MGAGSGAEASRSWPVASPSVASALGWRFLVTCHAGKMLCKTEHEYDCDESQNRVSGPIIERRELDLLREIIRSESVTVIGSKHPTDEEGRTMRHVDPGHAGWQS